MNARKRKDHERLIEHLKTVTNAISDPTPDKYKSLLNTCSWILSQLSIPKLSEVKQFPGLNEQYLKGIRETVSFDFQDFIHHLDKVDDARKLMKTISMTSDPYRVISNMLQAPALAPKQVSDHTMDYWKAIIQLDPKKKLEEIQKALKSLSGQSGIRIVSDVVRYAGVIVLVIGTLLRNYLICLVALGLLGVDMVLSQYIQENIDEASHASILDDKNFPYILTGSYPLLRVNRGEEYYEVLTSNGDAYLANNLIDLVKKVHLYMDHLGYTRDSHISYPEHPILNRVREIIYMPDRLGEYASTAPDMEFRIKRIILNISRDLIDMDLKMTQPQQFLFCQHFMDQVEAFCRGYAGCYRDSLMNYNDIVQMFELLCMQIWESFLNQNQIRKVNPQQNLYLGIILNDETDSIRHLYNSQQPLTTIRNKPSLTLANSILESVNKPTLLQEAAPNPNQSIQQTISTFDKTIQTAKEGASSLSKAIDWVNKNQSNIQNNARFLNQQDYVEIRPYTYNTNNLKQASSLLSAITTYLTSGYQKDRDQSPTSINRLIAQYFPSLKIQDMRSPFSPSRLAGLIATGQPNELPSEQRYSGQQLQSQFKVMVNYLNDPTVKNYFQSPDQFDKLQYAVQNFQNNTKNQAKSTPTSSQSQQQSTTPKQESIANDYDSILLEADQPQTTHYQQQGSQNDPNNKDATPPTPPTTKDKSTVKVSPDSTQTDSSMLRHAIEVATSILATIQNMTRDAYSVIAGFDTVLKNRAQQAANQQQSTQRQ